MRRCDAPTIAIGVALPSIVFSKVHPHVRGSTVFAITKTAAIRVYPQHATLCLRGLYFSSLLWVPLLIYNIHADISVNGTKALLRTRVQGLRRLRLASTRYIADG